MQAPTKIIALSMLTTPLLLAATKGSLAIIQLLLRADARLPEREGARLIHVAAELGTPKVLKILLDAGAPLNSRANDGASPLFRAAERGHYTSAKLLIKRGAPIESALHDGTTPLAIAVKNNHAPIVALLLENNAHSTLSDPDQGVSSRVLKLI